MCLQKVGWEGGGMNWIELAQVEGFGEGSNEPSCSINCRNFWTSLGNIRFSRRILFHGISSSSSSSSTTTTHNYCHNNIMSRCAAENVCSSF
jgi:hypothetical protein